MTKIGSKYWENRAQLEREIREGALSVVELGALRARCYFCSSPISSDGKLLVRHSEYKGYETTSRYFSHTDCYNEVASKFNGSVTPPRN